MTTRLAAQRTQDLLARRIPQRGQFLLGAAIGTGMAAKAAQRGGADFLLALNAGRFRSMGSPSAACMLAMRNSNHMVMEFGRSELLTHSSVPVFFGATAPRDRSFSSLVADIAEAGFKGIANFPSCVFLDGRYRQFLESAEIGFAHEMALLREARRQGLSTLAYVHTLDEARIAAKNRVDIVNLDFGWNMGGTVGVASRLDLNHASVIAQECVSATRAIYPGVRCVIEGGPIVTPEEMDQVCRSADADGYIGGSTIDRLPLESAVEMATGAFKAIGSLRRQVDSLERKLSRLAYAESLIGFSEAVESARERVAHALDSALPVMLVGEPGTGRRTLAQFIHDARIGKGRWLVAYKCGSATLRTAETELFGAGPVMPDCAAGGLMDRACGSTLLLQDVGSLHPQLQRRLLNVVKLDPALGIVLGEIGRDAPQFIGIMDVDPMTTTDGHQLDAAFAGWLCAARIVLPPLRNRMEDLPMIAENILKDIGGSIRLRLDPSAYRVLMSHDWPGNLQELRAVLRACARSTKAHQITDRDVERHIAKGRRAAADRNGFSSEYDWIQDGLRRNRFRRAETAQFLRISRKTLYNKMRLYLLKASPGP